jgi:hypothetical protein
MRARLLLLLAYGSAQGIRDLDMEMADPHLAFAAVDLLS